MTCPSDTDDVEFAVGVEVAAGGAEAHEQPPQVADAVPPADVQELAATLVAVERERLPLVVGDPDVGQAVTVVVAQVHAHAAVRHPLIVVGHARQQAALGEPAPPVVDVQEVVHRVVGDVDVDVAVEIEVGQEHA